MNTTKQLLRACPICKSVQGEVLHKQKFILPKDNPLPDEYDIVSCSNCGFTYADTGVTQQVYDVYYELLSKYEDKETSSGGGYNEFDSKRIDVTVEELESFCPNKKCAIIDIGCANGGILKKLKEKGYTDLTGFDPSKKCVDDVQNNGINCVQGSIFEACTLLEQRKFDCVILTHVMEHIYDLSKAFKICFELLKEKGQLYVEVPDAEFYADNYVIPYYYFDCEHINHFDEISLSNIGNVNGFSKKYSGHKIMQVSENQKYPALFAVFEKGIANNKPVSFSTLAKESVIRYLELSMEKSYSDILSKFAETQEEIYVFGAGNFTLRLLASTDLSKCNIKAFVDNDTNKQGRLLENRPIIPPEVLNQFNGTIIVCSALYAQDIVNQIGVINPNIQTVIIK